VIYSRQASAFVVTYPVNNAVDKEGNGTRKAVAWEKTFIQLVKVSILYMGCSWAPVGPPS